MRKLLLLSAVMVAASVTAYATSSAFNGFYVGAGAGGVRSKTKTDTSQAFDDWVNNRFPSKKNKISNDLILGLYTGYGKSLNDFYIGGEISITGDFSKRTVSLVKANDPQDPPVSYDLNTKYVRGLIISLSPRFGYIFGNNLIYIKPGIEISRDKASAAYHYTNTAINAAIPKLSYSASTSKTNIVFTPAFGYERVCGPIIMRGEYTYNPGKKISIQSNVTAISTYNNASYSEHRFIVGIAYKF